MNAVGQCITSTSVAEYSVRSCQKERLLQLDYVFAHQSGDHDG